MLDQPTDDAVIRVECRCDARQSSMDAGEFQYWGARRAWYFTYGARRQMTAEAFFRAFVDRSEYYHEDHRGEPYLFYECPWCDLPLPLTEEPKAGQADGA